MLVNVLKIGAVPYRCPNVARFSSKMMPEFVVGYPGKHGGFVRLRVALLAIALLSVIF